MAWFRTKLHWVPLRAAGLLVAALALTACHPGQNATLTIQNNTEQPVTILMDGRSLFPTGRMQPGESWEIGIGEVEAKLITALDDAGAVIFERRFTTQELLDGDLIVLVTRQTAAP